MARNGSGTYNRAVSPYVGGTVVSETAVNSEMDDIATALTQSISKDGQTTPTANQPMATFRHTGVGNGAARTDYAALGQVQDGTALFLGTSSGTNTITASATPAIAAYAAGQTLRFKAGGTNTGAVTLNLNSLGAKAVQKRGAALVSGDITANNLVEAAYDGTQFQMTSPAAAAVVPAASTSVPGIVELATTAETTTGTATDRAITPDGLKDMTSLAGAAWFLDEDAMGTNSATKVASQQSVKAYVTSSVAAVALPRVLLVNTEITGTPSALTFEDADGMNWSTYKYFEFELSSFVSVAMNILVQMSQGGSYETGGTDYAYGSAGVTFTAGADHDHSSINCPHAAEIYKGSGGYDEGFALSGTLHLNITDGTDKMGPFFHWSLGSNVAAGGYAGAASGTGWLRNGVSTAIDGIKFSCSSGNLVDGHFRVWGIK